MPHIRWKDASVSCIPWTYLALWLVSYIDKRERRKDLQMPISSLRHPRQNNSVSIGISPRGYGNTGTSDSHELSTNEYVSQSSVSAVTDNEGTSE